MASPRKSPSQGDKGGRGKGRVVGAGGQRRHELPPPALTDQHPRRCPVCRQACSVTPCGYLRRHVDLFGVVCPNKATGDAVTVDLPPVVIADNPNRRPPRTAPDRGPSRLDAGSTCEDCGKWLPGERRVCGACFVTRSSR